MRSHDLARLLVALAALSLLQGCGKKGPPLPPLKVRPEAVSDLAVRQVGGSVVISFSPPRVTVTGDPSGALDLAEVYKLRLEEPQAVREASEGEEPSSAPRGRFIGSAEFLAGAERLTTIEREDLARSMKEGKVKVRDDLATEPIGGEIQHRLYYGVRVIDAEGRESDVSNIQSLVPLPPPGRPEELQASVAGTVVKLDWSPPKTGPQPAGYVVYRAADGGSEKLLTGVPTKETEYRDAALSGVTKAMYRVRSSVTLEQPFVESAEAAEAEIALADVEAPVAPGKVRVSSGPGRLEVYWERSASPDVVGYHVYRAEKAEGPYLPLTDKPVPETVYLDAGASTGKTHFYAIAAVDGAGNESKRSEAGSGRR